ncbi:response regulator transcription factor [Desulfosarcina variabilis]|uniref:helix-turn-helix transcriptional regulator n=1 Tax=Desulfosarcina variabilis TaxID=2300 RepID=UPI003AFB3542
MRSIAFVDDQLTRAGESGLIHVFSSNRALRQSLAAILRTAVGAGCNDNAVCPMGPDTDQLDVNATLYLIDCMACETDTLLKLIRLNAKRIAGKARIVLFNANNGDDFKEFIDSGIVGGVFYRNDSMAAFIKGMRAILAGGKWLSRVSSQELQPTATVPDVSGLKKQWELLSNREREVLHCIAKGMNNSGIAQKYDISQHTVKTHVYNIYRKIQVTNRMQASNWAKANSYKNIE